MDEEDSATFVNASAMGVGATGALGFEVRLHPSPKFNSLHMARLDDERNALNFALKEAAADGSDISIGDLGYGGGYYRIGIGTDLRMIMTMDSVVYSLQVRIRKYSELYSENILTHRHSHPKLREGFIREPDLFGGGGCRTCGFDFLDWVWLVCGLACEVGCLRLFFLRIYFGLSSPFSSLEL